MNTIITIDAAGNQSGSVNIALNPKLHDLHPEAASRKTIISKGVDRVLGMKELLRLSNLTDRTKDVLQVHISERQKVIDRKLIPTELIYEIDLKM